MREEKRQNMHQAQLRDLGRPVSFETLVLLPYLSTKLGVELTVFN